MALAFPKRHTAAAPCAVVGMAGVAAGGATAASPGGTDQSHSHRALTAHAPLVKHDEVRQHVRAPRHAAQKGVEPRSGGPTTNIVGGTIAPNGAFPWFASLQTTGGFAFCGGSLI